jgi:hypothetical protein
MDQQLFDLRVDAEVSSYLGQTARWAKFIAIVGFVMCGIMAILSFFLGALLTTYSAATEGGVNTLPVGFLSAIYLVLAVVLIVPYVYLFNFASKMQRAIQQVDQDHLAKSFSNLKSCFKYIGIATIIGLVFYAIAIVLVIANAVMNQGG